MSNFYGLKEKEDDSGFLCIILSIFTLKIARTVTGSVDEMRAPNVRQTRYGIEYVQPNNPKTHLQQNHSAHSSVPYSAEFDQENAQHSISCIKYQNTQISTSNIRISVIKCQKSKLVHQTSRHPI